MKSADSKEVTVPLLHETGSIRMIVPTRITTIKPRIITWNLESLFFLIMLFSIILFCRYDRPVSGSGLPFLPINVSFLTVFIVTDDIHCSQ